MAKRQKINLKKIPTSLLPVLEEYTAARDARRALEAEARATAKTLARAQRRLLDAIGAEDTALCGDLLITVKRGSPIEASLTLVGETSLGWKDVESLRLRDGRVIRGQEVVSVYGGRAGSIVITAVKTET